MNNEGARGGGINCNACGGVYGRGWNLIRSNDGGYFGGGIMIEQGGSADLGAGTVIQANEAGWGAGVMAMGGSELTFSGVEIVENQAILEPVPGAGFNAGGGLFVDGSTLVGRNLRIDGNQAGVVGSETNHLGGGILINNSTVRLEGFSADCGPSSACSSLVGNRAHGGAAVHVSWGSEVEVLTTRIDHNEGVYEADRVANSVLYTEADLLVEGSVLTGNRTRDLIYVDGAQARAILAFLTTYGNFPGSTSGEVVSIRDGAAAELFSSILAESPSSDIVNVSQTSSIVVECLAASELVSLPPMEHELLVGQGSGLFVDAAFGDFHLAEGSLAIDFCDAATYEPVARDMDGGFRGMDAPREDRFASSFFDLGADEWGSSSVVFSDGFESGYLGAWSSSGP